MPCSIRVARTIEGSGLGTSSAVLVALVAALRVAAGGQVEPAEIAAAAHRFETGSGHEAGVQDHVAAAFGGVSLITVDYPHAHRQAVPLGPATLAELDRRLITVWLGSSHESSAMHDEVIARLASDGSPAALDRIRSAARLAADALVRDDLDAYGTALMQNHDALDGLHPALVSDDARVARRAGSVVLGDRVEDARRGRCRRLDGRAGRSQIATSAPCCGRPSTAIHDGSSSTHRSPATDVHARRCPPAESRP